MKNKTAVEEIFEQFNLLSDKDFKSWMFANVDRLEKQDDKIVSLITHWSKTFNLPIKEEKGFPDKARTTLALRLIEEEYKETFQACAEGNLKEVQDGLGDLLWVTIRAMMEHGINPLETIEKIYESNMSKADYTLDDVEFTRNKYLKQGIETYVEEVQNAYITHRKSDGKVLKSHNFKEPVFNKYE